MEIVFKGFESCSLVELLDARIGMDYSGLCMVFHVEIRGLIVVIVRCFACVIIVS